LANELNVELESFLTNYPSSSFAPGVRLKLARDAQLRSSYLSAMDHYAHVWDAMKQATSRVDMQSAAEAAGGLAKLFALTGRLPELDALEVEAKQSSNKLLPADGAWRWAMEMHAWAKKHPKESYKCGLYCLDQLGRLTQAGQFLPKNITETDSSTNGFTAAELIQIGAHAGLRIHAALLKDFSNVPVPCIVHLKSEHFVAVREKRGDFYDVYDPVAFGPRWLLAEEIAHEASGCVIVSDTIPGIAGNVSLTSIDSVAANAYRGRCHGPLAYDHNDPGPCTDCSCPPGTDSGGNGKGKGPNDAGCSKCMGPVMAGGGGGSSSVGMPSWYVSEPYLSLWVLDTPLEYKPAYGPDVSLHLAYNDRNSGGIASYWQGSQFGNQSGYTGIWACTWLSFAELDNSENTVDLELPGGGRATFTFPSGSSVSDINYRHNNWVEKVGSAGAITSLILHQPDGSILTYGVHDSTPYGLAGLFYLSSNADPSGDAVTFSYDSNFYLTNVTAADGTSFTLHYGSSNPSYITSVTSSYGSSVTFTYDSYYGTTLIGIADAGGIQSQFVYETPGGGAVNQLITPYGTTLFNTYGPVVYDRFVQITNANGTQEFYAQLNDYVGATGNTDWPDYAGSQIPTNTPLGTLDSDAASRQERNTFYWNAQQYAPLIGTDPSTFNWSVFKKARIRHWLANTDPTYTHFDSLSVEQAPSPDGTTEGQITWYDYAGKPSGVDYEIGTQIYPSVIARVMPDSSTWYQYSEYNSIGKATSTVEKWNEGAATLLRTNLYAYAANGIDRIAWTNAMGVLAESNLFNTHHQVTTNYDALSQPTIYTYDGTTLQPVSVSRPTGLVTTNVYDATSHRLLKTIDLQISRTNSYTWAASGDVQTHTDERNLTVTNYWDGLHRLTGTAYPDGTTTTNLYSVGSAYPNSSGGLNILDLTATRDRMGFWTGFAYDSLRRKIGETNANGVVTAYGYCDCGSISYITNAFGAPEQFMTYFDLDYQAHRIVTHYPDANTTNWFDSLGRLTITGDNWGYRYFNYDNLSRMTNISNAYGGTKHGVRCSRPADVCDGCRWRDGHEHVRCP
jgi:YD repeat-containing protein